jgi:hypothetical protein
VPKHFETSLSKSCTCENEVNTFGVHIVVVDRSERKLGDRVESATPYVITSTAHKFEYR